MFARFSGCNLKCNYCDTDFESYREYQPQALLSEIKGFGEGFIRYLLPEVSLCFKRTFKGKLKAG